MHCAVRFPPLWSREYLLQHHFILKSMTGLDSQLIDPTKL